MAYSVTLLQLRTKVRQRTDLVNSQFITDAELTDWINDSITELYDLLVTAYGEDYYQVLAPTFSTVVNQALYALDGTVVTTNDFFKLAGLDVVTGTGPVPTYVPLRRFMPAERTRNQLTNWVIPTFGNVRYRITGSNVELLPIPTGIFQLRPRYVPRAPILVADSDIFDGINGWHEYVVADAGGKCMEKQDLDASAFTARKMFQVQRITDASKNRDQGEPNRVVDVTGLTDNYSDDYFDLWR